jgi:putative membrane protein
MTTYRGWLLVVFVVAVVATGIAPYDRGDWLLEHTPTAAAVAFFVWYEKRPGGRPLGNGSYTLLFVFSLLHVLGAHYLYSRVPYDAWSQALFGSGPSQWLGSERNHYDRLVHLCFGLLVLPPMAELVDRHVARSRGWALLVAIAFIGVLSKVYELLEWWIALAMSPEAAEAYNGQQGDMFDAHKDMALALGGSLVSGLFVARRWRRQRSDAAKAPAGRYPAGHGGRADARGG